MSNVEGNVQIVEDAMTIEDLIGQLKYVSTSTDWEARHELADYWLLQYINNEEVTQIFNEMDKWYA